MRERRKTLRKSLEPVVEEQKQIAGDIQKDLTFIEHEAQRVAEIMYSTPQILEDLDQKFSETTKLTRSDMVFLFIATGIQCLRQYVFANDSFRLTNDQNEKIVKDPIKKITPPEWHKILCSKVPYDAVNYTDNFRAILSDPTIDLNNPGLSGKTHRYRTLGHDPIFGWVFGPANILTESLTKTDFITTYATARGPSGGYKIDNIYSGGTFGMINTAINFSCSDKYLLPTAVLRQAIHFGSDYFTSQGLPIPSIASIDNDFAKALVTRLNIDMYSVMRGAALSMLINSIIKYVHTLFYNDSCGISLEIYGVRTRKILSYSNAIASGSNIIYVAVNGFLGNASQLKKLDIGGILVTVYRIISDYRYVAQIKKEFLEKEFHKIVMNSNQCSL